MDKPGPDRTGFDSVGLKEMGYVGPVQVDSKSVPPISLNRLDRTLCSMITCINSDSKAHYHATFYLSIISKSIIIRGLLFIFIHHLCFQSNNKRLLLLRLTRMKLEK